MSIRLEKLKYLGTKWRLDRILTGFETDRFVRAEQSTRCKLLRSAAAMATRATNEARATELADALSHTAVTPRRRCSSPTFMREQRINIHGSILEFMGGEPGEVVTFTALPRDTWRVPVTELESFDAPKLCAAYRSALYRAGAGEAEGWVIGFLEAEYNPVDRTLHFHFHGSAGGEMVKVINKLRRSVDFGNPRAIEIRRPSPEERPRAVSYTLKLYWKSVPRFPDGKAWPARRIPEPAHSRVLLWLDRYRPSDLAVSIGLRVHSAGHLERTKRVQNMSKGSVGCSTLHTSGDSAHLISGSVAVP